MKDPLAVASEAALAAGAMLKTNFGKIDTIEYKSDRTLVTNLDKKSERMIVDALLSVFPDHGIIGEEGGVRESRSGYTWVIDPIDGTHNYIRSIPWYGVCIALLRHEEIVAGVIYMPSDDELFAAEAGSGACKNNRKIAVSRYDSIEECTCSFDSAFRNDPKKMATALERLAGQVRNIRMSGSSARNLTLVAEGKIDASVEFDDRIWDYCAGVALIREAGGTVTNHAGERRLEDHGAYVASNGRIHSSLLQIVNLP
jgi:myo-inositol-1(or 4)-monophosphatase